MLLKNFVKVHLSKDKKLRISIKNIFGFYPGNIFLYKLALRHRSASLNKINGVNINNERLEYLGDAILGAVVAEFLFKRFPYEAEGFLTEMRSKIVSRSSLNKLSYKLGLSKLILSSDQKKGTGKSAAGDAFEAFVGALYLDKGYKFTRKIIINRIVLLNFDVENLMNADINYKSKMIEWSQKEKHDLHFELVEEIKSKHNQQYIVQVIVDGSKVALGRDLSKKGAEKLAAEKAWIKLGLSIPTN
ncbi:MAG: ribonuclease III [Bacteroidetes bacterium]|nr:MAG: ribonuclease III [Bacteroidota bacterium]